MVTVTVYVRDACPECDQTLADLAGLQDVVPHRVVQIDATSDNALMERYGGSLPVIEVGPYRLRSPFQKQDLQVVLSAARDRVDQLERVDQEGYQQQLAQGHTIRTSDRLSFGLSKHYLLLINLLIFIYVGLPFLAPVLMKAGMQGPALIVYRIYSPICHQLAFRSWFLFGEQAYYPRSLASIAGVVAYEEMMDVSSLDLAQARGFVGNEVVDYKVALCQRDVAIYGAMLLFGLLFAATGRRAKSVSWYWWVALGLVPMGIDGVSQLPSVISNLPAWVLVRESSPFLRTLTGGLFGWMTAWYLFPMIEATMRETRHIMQRKFAVAAGDKQSGGLKE